MKKQHLNIIYCAALICLVCILSLVLSQITAFWQKAMDFFAGSFFAKALINN